MGQRHKSTVLGPACDGTCPVKRAANILDGKWTTQIIRELVGGTRRFTQLQQALNGVSPKVLTARLKMLQSNNLVHKTIYPCVPPKTEYQLTDLGQGMIDVIRAMAVFGATLDAEQGNRDRDA